MDEKVVKKIEERKKFYKETLALKLKAIDWDWCLEFDMWTYVRESARWIAECAAKLEEIARIEYELGEGADDRS